MTTYPISDIESIAPAVRARLKAKGIRTTSKLLEQAKSVKDRQLLSEETNIDQKCLLEAANFVDRMRIKGVGEEYSKLLQEVGVDTVRELRYRNPANLAEKMAEANAQRKLVRVLPSKLMISRWIEEAKKLPLIITY
jgi:predicted flap endonuclease-1-like 5' DNA nuclease